MKFRIFAGLGGGFGGAHYQGTFEYKSKEEAEQDAYEQAVEEYQSYEGYHGIMAWEDCERELMEFYYPEIPTEDDIDNYYTEEIESWIDYSVEQVPDDTPEWEILE